MAQGIDDVIARWHRYMDGELPDGLAELLRRHSCSALIPTVADAGDGILVLDQAPGLALTQHLYRGAAPDGVVPLDPQVLITALDTLRTLHPAPG